MANHRVSLQTEFYRPECVARALADFEKYLTAKETEQADAVLIELSIRQHADGQDQLIVREFLNYALDLTLKRYFEAT